MHRGCRTAYAWFCFDTNCRILRGEDGKADDRQSRVVILRKYGTVACKLMASCFECRECGQRRTRLLQAGSGNHQLQCRCIPWRPGGFWQMDCGESWRWEICSINSRRGVGGRGVGWKRRPSSWSKCRTHEARPIAAENQTSACSRGVNLNCFSRSPLFITSRPFNLVFMSYVGTSSNTVLLLLPSNGELRKDCASACRSSAYWRPTASPPQAYHGNLAPAVSRPIGCVLVTSVYSADSFLIRSSLVGFHLHRQPARLVTLAAESPCPQVAGTDVGQCQHGGEIGRVRSPTPSFPIRYMSFLDSRIFSSFLTYRIEKLRWVTHRVR